MAREKLEAAQRELTRELQRTRELEQRVAASVPREELDAATAELAVVKQAAAVKQEELDAIAAELAQLRQAAAASEAAQAAADAASADAVLAGVGRLRCFRALLPLLRASPRSVPIAAPRFFRSEQRPKRLREVRPSQQDLSAQLPLRLRARTDARSPERGRRHCWRS